MAKLKSKGKNLIEDVKLCDGISLDSSFLQVEEKRTKTLMLKGFIVFLLSFGSIGSYLSAFNIQFNVILVVLILLPVAILCALLYYKLSWENMGYIMVFGLFIALVFVFTDYINSGFYAIVNITIEEASTYFDVKGLQSYGERIENRFVTVTFAFIFIGVVLEILLNVYISRRMQHLIIIPITMTLLAIPLYLEREPNLIYVIMHLSGIAMAYIIKQGKHYGIRRNNHKFSKDKNQNIIYNYNIKAMSSVAVWILVIITLFVGITSFIKPVSNFNVGYRMNENKEKSKDYAAVVVVSGIAGLFNYDDSAGGVNGGELGVTPSITPDYETDLIVSLAPFSNETVYLRSYVGVEYVPYENRWITNQQYNDFDLAEEYSLLENNFNDGKENSAKASMLIENIDAYGSNTYYPYYMGEEPRNLYIGSSQTYTFYPNINTEINLESAYDFEPYLKVPDELGTTLMNFCNDNQISGTPDEIIQKVNTYFSDNVPYTMRPGSTPRNKDFIINFLVKNKKGYCAHFASSTTMIYRYMGIPARYVEGYAISYSNILDGELSEDKEYSDFYEGYSELGETAVVDVEVPDAWAHAWVEVYIEGEGWIIVDPTPASSGEEDYDDDFWSTFSDFFSDDDEGAETALSTSGIMNFRFSNTQLKLIWGSILLVSVLVISFVGGKRILSGIKKIVIYTFANRSDKLVIRYSAYYRKRAKKDKKLAGIKNYEEQVGYLEKGTVEESQKVIKILDQAGFSGKEITKSEYHFLKAWIKKPTRKPTKRANKK